VTLNQQYLHDRISHDANVAVEVVKRVMQSYQDVVARSLARGETVMQTNFMSFTVIERDERRARNPQTGETVTVPAQRAVKVAISDRLLEIVRSGITEVDGHKVTLRKLPKGGKGIVSVVTADPNARKLRVRAPKSKARRSRTTRKTA
jgi:Bacterial nucleoid DNA-binding protein